MVDYLCVSGAAGPDDVHIHVYHLWHCMDCHANPDAGGVNMTLTLCDHCILVEASQKDRHHVAHIATWFNLEVDNSAYEGVMIVRFKRYEDIYKFMVELSYNYMSISVD